MSGNILYICFNQPDGEMGTSGLDELLQQFKANDKNAINLLYERYSKRLYSFAYAYLKTEMDALDVVQEVFINVWNKRNNLRNDTNLEAYLFTVTKNSIITIFRKKISEKQYFEHLKNVAILYHSDTEDSLDYQVLSERLSELVTQLPEQRRLIFKMSKEKGMSNKAIAEELHISVKTVEDHMTKARHYLKKQLTEYGIIAFLFYEMFIS
ncbi:MAG TPA: RNA polymerase sigma-70 factor [Prolixibacteraceae bacterium]|nr:RNA polymerase sigma-70 factor [Prolixibacteraceae bacterium]